MLRGAASHANDDVGIGMLNGRPPTVLNADLNGIVYSRTAPQARAVAPRHIAHVLGMTRLRNRHLHDTACVSLTTAAIGTPSGGAIVVT